MTIYSMSTFPYKGTFYRIINHKRADDASMRISYLALNSVYRVINE